MARFVSVAKVSDLAPGKGKVVNAEGQEIALFNVDGQFYAVTNACLHQGGPLGEGDLEGKTVTCPWHGWEYDVTTGAATMDPKLKLQKYNVRVEGADVQVEI